MATAAKATVYPLLGHCTCPECGFSDAEIRLDTKGKPYRICRDGCGAQYFTHGQGHQPRNLLAKLRPAGQGARQ